MKLSHVLFSSLALALSSAPAMANDCLEEVNNWPYSYETGNETAGVYVSADFTVVRNCQTLAAVGEAVAGGRVLTIEASLVEFEAIAQLNNRRNFSVKSDLTVLGNTMELINIEEKLELVFSDSLSYPVDLSDSSTIDVGPIPVDLEYGIAADLGASYQLTLAIIEADLNVRPSVDSSAYVSAGVDVGVAFAKGSGELLVLDDRMVFDAMINVDQINFDKVNVQVYADNDLAALSGRVDVEAGVNMGPIQRQAERTLIEWPGYSRQDEIVNYADVISIVR